MSWVEGGGGGPKNKSLSHTCIIHHSFEYQIWEIEYKIIHIRTNLHIVWEFHHFGLTLTPHLHNRISAYRPAYSLIFGTE